jgi:hypothetical protein
LGLRKCSLKSFVAAWEIWGMFQFHPPNLQGSSPHTPFCGAGYGTQSLTHAGEVFCHLAIPPALADFFFFWDGALPCCQGWLQIPRLKSSSCLNLLSSWDSRWRPLYPANLQLTVMKYLYWEASPAGI